jgi:hypothetical protein
MRLRELSSGGRHDGAFRHQQLPARLNRRPHVVLADEVERDLRGFNGKRRCG